MDGPDLRTSLGAAPLVRDVVRVHGPDAVDFLQGQLSQDVAGLEVDQSAPAFLLQPTGKVDAWLRVTRLDGEELLLDVDRGHGEAVLARLRRFLLRTRAELVPGTWSGLALRGPGAEAVEVPPGAVGASAGWPGVEGVDLLAEGDLAVAGVPLVGAGSLEALRVECGVPAMGAEVTEATIPAEVGAWALEASVSFTKGCYTGQELVARVDSRGGNVPRPVRGLRVAGDAVPPVGAAVSRAGDHLGSVTSAATSPRHGPIALAPLGRRAEPGAEVEVAWEGGRTTAAVVEPPFR